MDYASEQAMEIEALEAILMDDFQTYEGTVPSGWANHGQTYKVLITPGEEDGSQDEDPDVILELLFAHTPSYPDDAPIFKARSGKGLSDKDLQDVENAIQAEIQNNLGMAMIFQLVTVAREWLQTKGDPQEEEDPEAARKRADAEEEARRAAARAHGTMVTVEVFKDWVAKFEAEMALEKAKLAEKSKDADKGEKISGKQYFLRAAASEAGDEDGALTEDDEGDFDDAEDADFDDFEDDDDDDDDDEMLNQYLATKTT